MTAYMFGRLDALFLDDPIVENFCSSLSVCAGRDGWDGWLRDWDSPAGQGRVGLKWIGLDGAEVAMITAAEG